MGALDGIQEEIQRVAERAGNSVVGIGQRWGVGSGVVIAKGHVLTNAHNVRSDEVDVTLPDGHTATGQVIGHDIDGDVAVIGVDKEICRPSRGRGIRRRGSVPGLRAGKSLAGAGCA